MAKRRLIVLQRHPAQGLKGVRYSYALKRSMLATRRPRYLSLSKQRRLLYVSFMDVLACHVAHF